jgi:hypothetical protein
MHFSATSGILKAVDSFGEPARDDTDEDYVAINQILTRRLVRRNALLWINFANACNVVFFSKFTS